MKDNILKELWNVKDSIAKEHNYNIDNLVNFFKDKENKNKKDVVNLTTDKKSKKVLVK